MTVKSKKQKRSTPKTDNLLQNQHLREWINTIVGLVLLIVAIIGLYTISEINISLEKITTGAIETKMIYIVNETGDIVGCIKGVNSTGGANIVLLSSDGNRESYCPSILSNPFFKQLK